MLFLVGDTSCLPLHISLYTAKSAEVSFPVGLRGLKWFECSENLLGYDDEKEGWQRGSIYA